MDFFNLNQDIAAFQQINNEICRNHTLMTIMYLASETFWALKMIDASTKFPVGVLVGDFTDLGNYDECLTLDVQEEWGSFKGQHCLANTNMNVEDFPLITKEKMSGHFPYTWSICVPSTCSPNDVQEFLTLFLHDNVTVNPINCHVEEPRPVTTMDWVALCVICFFGILTVLSTAYDVRVTDPKRRRQILLAFSWYTNGKKLFQTNNTQGSMACLHGIRFLTVVWIVIGHIYFFTVTIPVVNMLNMIHDIRTWGHEVIIAAIFAVDTFLFLSGLLVCYLFHKSILLAVLILIHTGLIMHLASGPLWDIKMSWLPTNCKKNWWSAIFHIQNYLHPDEMCLPVTWYLSADMQLYLLSPLILLPLIKWPRFGIFSLQFVTLTSMIGCFLQLYMDNESPVIVKLNTNTPRNYIYTHTRATPWLVGMTMGYVLYETRAWRREVAAGTKNGLSKIYVTTGWFLATLCILSTIISMHFFTQIEVPDVIYTTLYLTFSRLIWPIGLSWIVFACVSGYGGPVNVILSWRFFQPMSRLTYCIYIIHVAFIRVKFYSLRAPLYYSDINKITEVMSTLVYVTFLAVPTTLTFEFPTLVIEKVLLGQKKKASRNQPEIRVAMQQSDFYNGPQGHGNPFYNAKQHDVVERNFPQNGIH
ncbi:hypothetical protein C0J52_17060 [Blattella germanica]|nr:hypothetical protein C0J52_17060 [Blattella germanica]